MFFRQIATFYFLLHFVHCGDLSISNFCLQTYDNGSYVMKDIELSGQTRNDLKCAEVNTTNLTCSKFRTQLCACSATAKWRLDGSKTGFLRLEYFSRNGVSRILETESTKDVEFDFYYLHVPKSFLSFIPKNVCEYPTMVMLNLANNRLIKLTT